MSLALHGMCITSYRPFCGQLDGGGTWKRAPLTAWHAPAKTSFPPVCSGRSRWSSLLPALIASPPPFLPLLRCPPGVQEPSTGGPAERLQELHDGAASPAWKATLVT